MKNIIKFLVILPLLSFASIAAFNFIIQIFYIGTLAGTILFIIALYIAYIIAFEERATIKQVVGFTAVVYIVAIPIDWLVKNSVIPDATSWGGLILHVVLGVLALVVALFAVARDKAVIKRLAPGG
jgi:prepilin signal peptidase PulO-like enzyme (type II secretory pathway)